MINSLTIVSVADTKITESISSLKKSTSEIKFEEILLFTSKSFNEKKAFSGLKIVKIKPLKSFKEYNHFIIYELFKYIKTSHILIVQWDGFILNPKKWDNAFYKYDYIGAPFIPRANDFKFCRDKNNNFYSVGNGGFTIRSRSLLEAPAKFALEDNFEYTNFHEDGFFSVYHRKFLESKGFKWAPFTIAKSFALESLTSFNDLIDLPLGFHGKKILKIHKLLLIIQNLSNLVKRLNTN